MIVFSTTYLAPSRRPDDSMPETFQRARTFLQSIGIAVTIDPVAAKGGFLPGLRVRGATITVAAADHDLAGDMMHEAGHIAVTPSLFRDQLDGNTNAVLPAMFAWLDAHPAAFGYPENPVARAIMQSLETEAIAWSYAAALAADIDSRLPFLKGFGGGGLDIHHQVEHGQHLGIHGLAHGGMTELPWRHSVTPFPKMKRWMQI
ncbi:hypothetical protein ABLE93_22740 [Xanthobacter sp. KR7-65]